jgi:hypothetical protein
MPGAAGAKVSGGNSHWPPTALDVTNAFMSIH